MKIGILVWDLSILGGAQRQVMELARQLKKSGDDISIYAVYYDSSSCSDLLDEIPVRYLFEGHRRRDIRDSKVLGVAIHSFPHLLREWRVSRTIPLWVDEGLDILNVHDNQVFTGASLWKKRTGKPVLWMMNDFPGAVFQSQYFPTESLNRLFDMANGKKMVRNWYVNAIQMLDRVVVLDRRNCLLLAENLDIVPVIIRSGLDLSKFSFQSREGYFGTRTFQILSTGIFLPHRRLEDLAGAVRILSDLGVECHWRHVGSEARHMEYAQFVRNRVERAGIECRCEFLGKVSDDELVRLYGCSDVFVFPNSPQTWGLAVFEAMACGTPVIVSRGAGASEVLTDGVDSLLVDPCRPDQIAAAIRRLASSPDDWKRLSTAGRKFVENNIRWDIYARNMREEMEMLCSGGKA